MERANQYLKDRMRSSTITNYHCMKKECDLAHVKNLLNLFLDIHYTRRKHMRFGELTKFLGGDTAKVYSTDAIPNP